MKKLLNLIYSSNNWYDNLTNGKREAFFVLVIMGTNLIAQILLYCYDNFYGILIWSTVLSAWRLPYMFRRKKTYTIDIETDGLIDNKHRIYVMENKK